MKLALIADIHGNRAALSAVLDDAAQQYVDQYLFLGDYIFDLPDSNEVTELLRSLPNAHIIQGNKEGYLRRLTTENQSNWVHEQMGALYQTFRELTMENRNFLMALPQSLTLTLPQNLGLYACHCIPKMHQGQTKISCSSSQFRRNMTNNPFTHQEFLVQTANLLQTEAMKEAVRDIDAKVVAVGHSHLQYYGYCGDTLVINPGSCGLPLDYDIRAPYTILHAETTGFTVEERRVPYAVESVIANARCSTVYKAGEVFCELVCTALASGRDEFSEFFALATKMAAEQGESGQFFSNEVWRETGKALLPNLGKHTKYFI